MTIKPPPPPSEPPDGVGISESRGLDLEWVTKIQTKIFIWFFATLFAMMIAVGFVRPGPTWVWVPITVVGLVGFFITAETNERIMARLNLDKSTPKSELAIVEFNLEQPIYALEAHYDENGVYVVEEKQVETKPYTGIIKLPPLHLERHDPNFVLAEQFYRMGASEKAVDAAGAPGFYKVLENAYKKKNNGIL